MSELSTAPAAPPSPLRASTGTAERLRRLEEEVQENRRLNRRLAELTDLVDRAAGAAVAPRRRRGGGGSRALPLDHLGPTRHKA